jgi:hypothetical protein
MQLPLTAAQERILQDFQVARFGRFDENGRFIEVDDKREIVGGRWVGGAADMHLIRAAFIEQNATEVRK